MEQMMKQMGGRLSRAGFGTESHKHSACQCHDVFLWVFQGVDPAMMKQMGTMLGSKDKAASSIADSSRPPATMLARYGP